MLNFWVFSPEPHRHENKSTKLNRVFTSVYLMRAVVVLYRKFLQTFAYVCAAKMRRHARFMPWKMRAPPSEAS